MFLIKKLLEMNDDELKSYFSAITPYNNALLHYNLQKQAIDKIYSDKTKLFFTLDSCKEVLKIANDKRSSIEDIVRTQNANACTILITLQNIKEIGQYITYSKSLSDFRYNLFYDFYYNLSEKFKYDHDNDSDYINNYLLTNKRYENLVYLFNLVSDEAIIEPENCNKLRKKIKFMVKDLFIFYNAYLENTNKMIAYYLYVKYKLVEKEGE
mgnify:CR=1 FL=1